MKPTSAPSDKEVEDSYRSYHFAEKTTDEPSIRVMALHALAYCERLFYLEEVEEIRRADANVYSGRRLHEQLDKGAENYTVELASERLNLRGKMDCVRHKSGSLVVCEHKRGRSKEGKEAWPSDRLQVLAYTLLLAEHTGKVITEACIKYHADDKLITVPIDLRECEKEVLAAVARARELRSSLERPPVTVPEKFCRTCALAPVCLPEEDRFAMAEAGKPERLFPADEDRQVIHIVEQGASVRKDGEQLVVYLTDGTKKPLPSRSVSGLVLYGNVQVSAQCVHFCAARDIGIHWLSYGGHYVGSLAPGAGGVQRRNRQYAAMQNRRMKARLAAQIAQAKVENQLRYVLRATRSKSEEPRSAEVEGGISKLRQELSSLAQIGNRLNEKKPEESCTPDREDVDAAEIIRGHEGMAARAYFGLLPSVLNLSGDDFLYFHGRNRRPPKDPFNALLSFGYALLYRDCMASLLAVGLEPAFGILHTPRSASYPLALDLMELFRVILWDIPLIGSVNRKQWSREDFEVTGSQVWLNPEGRRKAIRLYEGRKQEKWRHPVLDYSLSYARTIELEARLLEKEWSGNPGLFARLRLR